MPAVASAPPSAPATVASATTAAIAPIRRLPDDASAGVGLGVSAADAVAGRHDHHLAGEARRFRLHGVDLGSLSLWELRPSAASSLGRVHLGVRPPWVRPALGEVASCSGASFGASTSAAAVTGSPGCRRVGSGRPGAEGSGFTAGGLGLLFAHVGFSRIG